MNEVVRLTINEDGDETGDDLWHLVDPCSMDSPRTLCTGEVFGIGEGNARGTVKIVKRGGVTCPHCMQKILEYKRIKL